MAGATVPDTFGLGGRYLGMGGGGVALVDDGPAAMMNPAGLSRMHQPTAGLAFSAAFARVKEIPPLWWDTNRDGVVDERDTALTYDGGVEDALGLHFFMGRHVGGKFGIALAGYLPTNRLLRFATFEPSLPNYFMYSNRPQRYAMAGGVGGELFKGFNIGVGVDFVPRAKLYMLLTGEASITGDVDPEGQIEDLVTDIVIDVHELTLDLVPGFAPIVGVQVEFGKYASALDGLVLGAMYRGKVGLPIETTLDAQVNLTAEDIGDLEPFIIALVAKAGLNLFDHYVPQTAALGLAYKKHEILSGYVDVRWTDWRGMLLNVARLEYAEIESPLVSLDDTVHDGNEYEVQLRSVVSARAGAEVYLPRLELDNAWRYLQITLRAGVGWEPSPLVGQGEGSALLDADRMLFTVGGGVEAWDPKGLIDAPWRIDLFGQFHLLASGTFPHGADEPVAGTPVDGDTIPVGGHLLVVGGQISFDYN